MQMALASLAWQQEPAPAWQQRLVFSRLAWLLVLQLVLQRLVWLLASLRQVLRQWLAWRQLAWRQLSWRQLSWQQPSWQQQVLRQRLAWQQQF
jgi:hypothetical protein